MAHSGYSVTTGWMNASVSLSLKVITLSQNFQCFGIPITSPRLSPWSQERYQKPSADKLFGFGAHTLAPPSCTQEGALLCRWGDARCNPSSALGCCVIEGLSLAFLETQAPYLWVSGVIRGGAE